LPRFDVTTYGEGGLRLSVPAGERIETTHRFDVDVSGAEANVAGALSRLGRRCGWVSALPLSPPGRRVAHALRTAGIDLAGVVWRDVGRVSCYYVEYAEPPRATAVLFDRKDSCFAELPADAVDWSYLLDTRHIHLTGLTVPLSERAAEIVTQAAQRGKAGGASISFDINYRRQLWSPDKARERLLPICRGVNLLFCSQRDAADVFGCSGEPQAMAQQLQQLTEASEVVVSLGVGGVIGGSGEQFIHSPSREVTVIDRIGAGDAMAAGVLHGWLDGDLARGLRYGTTMAALAMSQHGDMVITDPRELERMAAEEHTTDIDR
jgi:2-dehydro-3-deoxygluconokinase